MRTKCGFSPKACAENDLALIRCCFQVPEMLAAGFFFKEACSDVLWKLYEVVLCAQGEKIDFTYSADGSCPLRIYLA